MFFPAGNFITVSNQQAPTTLQYGAAYQFFDRLDRFLKMHPDYYVDVIGHSMGAIVANEALRNFPDLRIRNLVYMAAACSIRDFLAVGSPWFAVDAAYCTARQPTHRTAASHCFMQVQLPAKSDSFRPRLTPGGYVWHARGEVPPTGSGDRQAPPNPFVEQHAADEQHAESKRLPYSGIIAELQS
jgi:pimeloyl-ACP methyl ester carboxylesterase